MSAADIYNILGGNVIGVGKALIKDAVEGGMLLIIVWHTNKAMWRRK